MASINFICKQSRMSLFAQRQLYYLEILTLSAAIA